jgi:protocatechuate 3,4-dioxygenase beta subunit
MLDLTFHEWLETYSPEFNEMEDSAPFNGRLYSHEGSPMGHVSESHPKRIWTYREDHHGNKIIVKGFFLDGALGFFLCDRIDNGEEVVTVHNVSQYV